MIIPAILEKDWASIESKIKVCENFANTLHIDFIDGKFAENSTFMDLESFKKYSDYFKLEAHLMIEEPINYLDSLYNAGFKKFIGHVEKMTDQVAFVSKAQGLGGVGLGLDLETPLSDIKITLDDLDSILLMSVKAGFSGQKFNEIIIDKIKELREKYLGDIEIDGGINDSTMQLAQVNGADSFCVTSFIFGNENPESQFRKLESLLSKF